MALKYVYIVFASYYSDDIIGVYSKKWLAEKVAKEYSTKHKCYTYIQRYTIQRNLQDPLSFKTYD